MVGGLPADAPLAGCGRVGVFEVLVGDVQAIVREWAGRKGQPTAVCLTAARYSRRRIRVRGPATMGPSGQAAQGLEGAYRGRHAGHLLALKVTAADQGDREQVAALAEEIQQVTSASVELAYVDQGYNRTERNRSRQRARHPARSGQAPASQTRLRAPAAPLGSGTKLRMGCTLPQARPRPRTARHHT